MAVALFHAQTPVQFVCGIVGHSFLTQAPPCHTQLLSATQSAARA
jgi:hypothetical protein